MIKGQHRQLTALVVDDEPSLLELLVETLQEEGFATIGCERGQPAIDVIKQHHFDLLLVDIGLPDMNGLHICETARAQYGNAIAILIITANPTKQRCVTALELGADDFLAKPFDMDELLTRIMVKVERVT